ncbi:MAG: hypothetical protein RBG13Loki_3980 [Promethearchaeota archaeon CR_4]|nr:MAG: hypothetical protein RBG13Loki_3980 [Candidatus Lokiarchaeota archaeon CR_4]
MDDDLKEILARIEKKVDTLAEVVETLKGKGAKASSEAYVKPSEKKVDHEAAEVPDSGGSRTKCPKCGSLKVTAHKDMKRVLSYSGGIPIYATKTVCNQCSNEW